MEQHGTFQQLRGAAWLFLSETGQVLSGTVVSDSGGGGTTVWSAGGTVNCRIDPLGGGEGLAGGRISDRTTHLLSVPPDVDVDERNRFAVTNRGTFEITALRERTSEPVRTLEVAHL
jgi:Phage head-tail joining protein